MYNVTFRASVDGNIDVGGSGTTNDEALSFGWFESVPDGQTDAVADDISIFLAD